MAAATIAGFVVAVVLSKDTKQRFALVAAFTVLALLVIVFYLIAIVAGHPRASLALFWLCIALPVMAYLLAIYYLNRGESGTKESGSSRDGSRQQKQSLIASLFSSYQAVKEANENKPTRRKPGSSGGSERKASVLGLTEEEEEVVDSRLRVYTREEREQAFGEQAFGTAPAEPQEGDLGFQEDFFAADGGTVSWEPEAGEMVLDAGELESGDDQETIAESEDFVSIQDLSSFDGDEEPGSGPEDRKESGRLKSLFGAARRRTVKRPGPTGSPEDTGTWDSAGMAGQDEGMVEDRSIPASLAARVRRRTPTGDASTTGPSPRVASPYENEAAVTGRMQAIGGPSEQGGAAFFDPYRTYEPVQDDRHPSLVPTSALRGPDIDWEQPRADLPPYSAELQAAVDAYREKQRALGLEVPGPGEEADAQAPSPAGKEEEAPRELSPWAERIRSSFMAKNGIVEEAPEEDSHLAQVVDEAVASAEEEPLIDDLPLDDEELEEPIQEHIGPLTWADRKRAEVKAKADAQRKEMEETQAHLEQVIEAAINPDAIPVVPVSAASAAAMDEVEEVLDGLVKESWFSRLRGSKGKAKARAKSKVDLPPVTDEDLVRDLELSSADIIAQLEESLQPIDDVDLSVPIINDMTRRLQAALAAHQKEEEARKAEEARLIAEERETLRKIQAEAKEAAEKRAEQAQQDREEIRAVKDQVFAERYAAEEERLAEERREAKERVAAEVQAALDEAVNKAKDEAERKIAQERAVEAARAEAEADIARRRAEERRLAEQQANEEDWASVAGIQAEAEEAAARWDAEMVESATRMDEMRALAQERLLTEVEIIEAENEVRKAAREEGSRIDSETAARIASLRAQEREEEESAHQLAIQEAAEKAAEEVHEQAEAEDAVRRALETADKARRKIASSSEAKAKEKEKAKASAKTQAKAEARAKAVAEARAKVEAEEAERLARKRARAEAQFKADVEARILEEAQIQMRIEAEARVLAEAKEKAKAEAEERARTKAEAMDRLEAALTAIIANEAVALDADDAEGEPLPETSGPEPVAREDEGEARAEDGDREAVEDGTRESGDAAAAATADAGEDAQEAKGRSDVKPIHRHEIPQTGSSEPLGFSGVLTIPSEWEGDLGLEADRGTWGFPEQDEDQEDLPAEPAVNVEEAVSEALPEGEGTLEDDFKAFLAKARELEDAGRYDVAAYLYAEAAGYAEDDDDLRDVLFSELGCYVRLGDRERALVLVDEILALGNLNPAEAIKIDAIQRMM